MTGTSHQTNNSIKFTPNTGAHGWRNPNAKRKRTRDRREVGVETVRDEYNEKTNRKGRKPFNPNCYSAEDQLTMADPNTPDSIYYHILENRRRVFEFIRATPLVIDFSNVQEPVAPHKLPPYTKGSTHPDAALYDNIRTNVVMRFPKRAEREAHYWAMIDAGELPQDFNPYPPKSTLYASFEERMHMNDDRPETTNFQGKVVLATERQMYRRAKRKLERGDRLTDEEFATVCKPVEEWDIEELAKGYPKNSAGQFPGRPPSQLMRTEMSERVEALFKQHVRMSMRGSTVSALKVIQDILDNSDTDNRGKALVSAGAKLEASKFLIEHLLGKPTQRVEEDISVKLSGILAGVMVSPETLIQGNSVQSTGQYQVSQRGRRDGYEDTQVQQLQLTAGVDYIDAEFDDDEEV